MKHDEFDTSDPYIPFDPFASQWQGSAKKAAPAVETAVSVDRKNSGARVSVAKSFSNDYKVSHGEYLQHSLLLTRQEMECLGYCVKRILGWDK